MYLIILLSILDSQPEALDTELFKIQNSNYLIFGNNKRPLNKRRDTFWENI